MEENKKLAGKVVLKHDVLAFDFEDDIIEYHRQMEPDIMARIHNNDTSSKR
jgi:hypothetical protein